MMFGSDFDDSKDSEIMLIEQEQRQYSQGCLCAWNDEEQERLFDYYDCASAMLCFM